ncbi:glycine--tRNA ligase subunit beta [Paramagnetospirillum kuznetsovii]|uniref:Glycine--tRNA ligase beta subunit n=1 Tax=Paramagnetospirillum kuznetsovii TaxID=2053833 RepID=A0A364NWF0_9PROT|nr:glycine--tRNA ligase subunit beta [Paramagnetospirillum kuznetsovii]RAU21414.1 glycine--tRNA ligase subunit beta [Paramagnetospirillum kuznetsovii]
MAELLLEILSEEIPARMQARAAEDLHRMVCDGLGKNGITFDAARSYVTPRRLVLVIEGLPLAGPDVSEEKRGPRVGSPAQAMEGFLKSTGMSVDQLESRDTGKGVFYFAVINRKGRPTAEVLKEVVEEAMAGFPWPKSMRWGANPQRWVRPIQSIICLLDGAVVPVSFGPVTAGNLTSGHRFLAPETFRVKDFAEYLAKLRHAKVMLDPIERRHAILSGAEALALAEGLTLKSDDGLLAEVTGLVEWPVPLVGSIDDSFMDVPAEVLITSMRSHQKYFSLLKADGSLAPRFIVISNMETTDGGKAVVAGNQRVLRARLSDAKFFWDTDRKHSLQSRLGKLDERLFYAKLGTLADKVIRIQNLVGAMPFLSLESKTNALVAATLCKADLSAEMVGEFPELQGIMGRYYALNDGLPAEVADAIAQHYSPLGPNDSCPTALVSVAVALADKIDSLVGFFGIDEKPTGSKDPFALRRAALGVIRLIVENGLRVSLLALFAEGHKSFESPLSADAASVGADLLAFFADRLTVALKEKGVRHDLINAVFSLGGEDDLVRLLARVDALDAFLKSDDGANLLVAYRRAANIVRIEEKKDGTTFTGHADVQLLRQDEEKALEHALTDVGQSVKNALATEDFASAMAALAKLRRPLDAFFDKVTVNADEASLRVNRLRLLAHIGSTMGQLADFSRVEG